MVGTRGLAETRAAQALELILRFADRTGLTTDRPPDRYLWTDAFAVCDLLGLGRTDLALRLVEQVHQTLGRHRTDDPRSGWISGLEPQRGEAHPTIGGLRIGKPQPERLDEPIPDPLEWEREGQYFHYLTKWMHALDQVAGWTGEPRFNVWARELAATAHRAFTYEHAGAGPGRGERRMYWKMSVDLSRPVVPSMGHHDPLDGYITCVQLDWTASQLGVTDQGPRLTDQAADFAAMIVPELATVDPLGLGGLLTDAWRVEQLTRAGAMQGQALLERLLDAALVGLTEYERSGELRLPASQRLAFRELGLAIGLAAVPLMRGVATGGRQAERLLLFEPLRSAIEAFWLQPEHRSTSLWLEHQNIDDVMLATSLEPSGYLILLDRRLLPDR